MTISEKAYLAGIIDGEGCISYTPWINKADGNKRYKLTLTVANTKKPLLIWIKKKLGFGTVINKGKWKTNPNHADVWNYIVCNQLAENVLKSIYKYLVIKQGHAKIAIEMRKTFSIGQNQTMSKTRKNKRENLLSKLRKLNKRGKQKD